jgi:hypothetical protein
MSPCSACQAQNTQPPAPSGSGDSTRCVSHQAQQSARVSTRFNSDLRSEPVPPTPVSVRTTPQLAGAGGGGGGGDGGGGDGGGMNGGQGPPSPPLPPQHICVNAVAASNQTAVPEVKFRRHTPSTPLIPSPRGSPSGLSYCGSHATHGAIPPSDPLPVQPCAQLKKAFFPAPMRKVAYPIASESESAFKLSVAFVLDSSMIVVLFHLYAHASVLSFLPWPAQPA